MKSFRFLLASFSFILCKVLLSSSGSAKQFQGVNKNSIGFAERIFSLEFGFELRKRCLKKCFLIMVFYFSYCCFDVFCELFLKSNVSFCYSLLLSNGSLSLPQGTATESILFVSPTIFCYNALRLCLNMS